jgi:threonine dehydratase
MRSASGSRPVIVMPEGTPTIKVTQTEGHGARVVLHGKIVDDAFAKARELEAEHGYVFVHAFDDPQIIAGAGTVGLEMLEDAPDSDTIVVPIGGGGLMSGVSIAARAVKPDIELIGVEAELYPSMKCAIQNCQMRSAATRWPRHRPRSSRASSRSRILAEYANDVRCSSPNATSSAGRGVAMLCRDREDVVRGRGRPQGCAGDAHRPRALQGQESRVPCCAAAISTRTCWQTCSSATSSARGGSPPSSLRSGPSGARSLRSRPGLRSRLPTSSK